MLRKPNTKTLRRRATVQIKHDYQRNDEILADDSCPSTLSCNDEEKVVCGPRE